MARTQGNRGHEVATEVAIRDAALRLFSTVGFAGTGIRLIAQEAGISLASLYHYMSSKEDLLVAMMRTNIRGLLTESERALEGLDGPVDRIRALVRVHVTIHATQSMLCVVSDTEIRSLSEEFRREIVADRDKYEALWRDAIDRGIEAGDFARVDTALASKALLQMCTGVAHWFRASGPLDIVALNDHYADMALGLLGSADRRPGR